MLFSTRSYLTACLNIIFRALEIYRRSAFHKDNGQELRVYIFMMVRATMVISVIITLLVLNQSTYCNAKRRWCTDGTLTEETQSMTEYNDEEQVCMKCENEEKLIDLQELNLHECCAGEVKPLGVCPDESVRHSCNRAQKVYILC